MAKDMFAFSSPVASELEQEPWVPAFVALRLGEDGEGLDGVAEALCEEGE